MRRTQAIPQMIWDQTIGEMMGGLRACGLLGVMAIALSACADDPARYGITGPFPEGVAPVTLTRPQTRADLSDDTPGIRADAVDRYAPTARIGATPRTQRYYGYDH